MRVALMILAGLVLVAGGIYGATNPKAIPLPLMALLCLAILWWHKDDHPRSHH